MKIRRKKYVEQLPQSEKREEKKSKEKIEFQLISANKKYQYHRSSNKAGRGIVLNA